MICLNSDHEPRNVSLWPLFASHRDSFESQVPLRITNNLPYTAGQRRRLQHTVALYSTLQHWKQSPQVPMIPCRVTLLCFPPPPPLYPHTGSQLLLHLVAVRKSSSGIPRSSWRRALFCHWCHLLDGASPLSMCILSFCR